MAKNTFKTTPPTPKPEKLSGFSAWLAKFFNIEDLVLSMPSKYLYYGIWLFFLVIFYIFFSHKYETYIRTIEKLKVEIDEKRSDYISKKASYMKETKKSEILQKVKPFGLDENLEPPQKIVDQTDE